MGNKASVEAELREQCRLDAARAASDRRRRAAAHTLENITKLASAGMHQDLARELAKIDVAHLRSFAGPVGLVAWVQYNLLCVARYLTAACELDLLAACTAGGHTTAHCGRE